MDVVHSLPVWLPQTQTWIATQLRFLPADVRAHVVCEQVENVDQFPWRAISCLKQRSAARFYWEKALQKSGIRAHTRFLQEEIVRLKARVVHSHFGNIGWRDRGAARASGAGHVVTFYGMDVVQLPTQRPKWRQRYRALFRDVSAVLCEGAHMAKEVIRLGCPEEKIRVHHLGVDLDGIEFLPVSAPAEAPLRVLVAASFREKKGIPDALEAVGRLRRERPVVVTVIGDATATRGSQAEKERIMSTVQHWGLQEHVQFLGFQPHARLIAEARRSHVFLQPSVAASDGDTEGGAPVSVIEMAAAGVPVVSTTHCDIPEVVIHGKTGLLAPERDPATLADHLRWMADHPHGALAMARAARDHVEREFSAKVQGHRLAECYRSIL